MKYSLRFFVLLLLSVCTLTQNLVPQTIDVASQAFKKIKSLGNWQVSVPDYVYGPGSCASFMWPLPYYTAGELAYVDDSVDDRAPGKVIAALDKRVSRYLLRSGWLKIESSGGAPETRCYRLNDAVVEIYKTTGRCSMNTPCRAFDSIAVAVYGSRAAVRKP